MPKKTRGRKREGEEDASEPQPCCIYACERYGTRLLTSLRATYQLKEDHSGRVCEGHYRRDLRRFKKHAESNASSSPSGKSRRSHNHDSDSMQVDGEYSSSRSSSPMNDFVESPSATPEYTKPQTRSIKIEPSMSSFSPIKVPALPASCASANNSLENSWDLSQVTKFKLFCDIVLRNEGVTH